MFVVWQVTIEINTQLPKKEKKEQPPGKEDGKPQTFEFKLPAELME